jgi:hypothetical protein
VTILNAHEAHVTTFLFPGPGPFLLNLCDCLF